MYAQHSSLRPRPLWFVLTATYVACSGTTANPVATGGTQSVATGGASWVKDTSGSTAILAGGTTFSDATGGVPATGGAASSAAGGSATGGAQPTGGTSTASGSGGRGAGICPGGTYPALDLSGSATAVVSSSDVGQYEGTLWISDGGFLVFSGMNISAAGTPATVDKLVPPNAITVIPDSGTNGLAVDFNGTVLAGSQKVQGIVSVDLAAGTVTTIVNTDANGKRFNSVNDLTVRTDGNIYFTDPDYQLSGRTSETGIKGVYRYSTSKVVSLIDGTFNQPNGISLSPDESVLYVADTGANRIRKFSVAADGSVSGKTDFATVSSPDGGGVDCAGNLYWASNAAPGKVVVISPTGTQLGTISLSGSDKPTNVAFGGPERKTLYISTSPRKIYSITLNIPGFPY